MKKLTEFKDDEAMDVLAGLIEPASHLFKNKEFVLNIRGNKEKGIKPDRIKAIDIAINEHRKDVVKIMAVLNQTPVEDFHYDLFTLPKMLLDIFNDEELISFFHYRAEMNSEASSGSVTENTEEIQDTSSDM
jgi:hypothetical protein